jgi:hypothetical protein
MIIYWPNQEKINNLVEQKDYQGLIEFVNKNKPQYFDLQCLVESLEKCKNKGNFPEIVLKNAIYYESKLKIKIADSKSILARRW